MRKLYLTLLVSAIISGSYAQTIPAEPTGTGSEAGIAEQSSQVDETVSIYPNPVKSFATISFTYQNIDKISILNIVGREIKTVTPENGKQEIKVSLVDLQPGVYFLAAYYQGSTLITKKFLKED